MRYPFISRDEIGDRLDDLIDGRVEDLSAVARVIGDGAALDLTGFESAVQVIRTKLDSRRAGDLGDLDVDQFEGAVAAELHSSLRDVDVEILDDPGFWAYVAAGPLWFFVRWREDPTKRNRETYHQYVDGTRPDMCVPTRMFLRAQAVESGGDYSLTAAIPAGTDFWRSHVLRVRSGSKAELARALTAEQRDDRMTVGPLRQYARRINRRWSNQEVHLLDAKECVELASDERP